MGLLDLVLKLKSNDPEEVSQALIPKKGFPQLENLVAIGVPYVSINREYDGKFHPSEAQGCARKMFFDRVIGPSDKGKPNWRKKVTFAHGDYVHTMLQDIFGAACVELGFEWEAERELNDIEADVTGSCDGKLHIPLAKTIKVARTEMFFPAGTFIVEFKSINSNGWPNVQVQPYDSHYMQVQLYMHMEGLDKAIIFYFHKDTGEMKQHNVALDEEFIRGVLRRFKYVLNATKKLEAPVKHLGCIPSGPGINKKCAQYVTCKKFEQDKLKMPKKGEIFLDMLRPGWEKEPVESFIEV